MNSGSIFLQVSVSDAAQRKSTAKLETSRRHALEKYNKVLDEVQALELKLLPAVWWTPDSAEWKEAKWLVSEADYRRCLDCLEGLIVARLFEFTKLNVSGTGVSLSLLRYKTD